MIIRMSLIFKIQYKKYIIIVNEYNSINTKIYYSQIVKKELYFIENNINELSLNGK